MPWKIVKRDGEFCVVKESDGKTVKCHSTREKAKSHLAALYVNEPSASKKSFNTGYGLLKSLITERVEELKGCGANKPGGGGFSAGNTCARGGGSSSNEATSESETRFKAGFGGTPEEFGRDFAKDYTVGYKHRGEKAGIGTRDPSELTSKGEGRKEMSKDRMERYIEATDSSNWRKIPKKDKQVLLERATSAANKELSKFNFKQKKYD